MRKVEYAVIFGINNASYISMPFPTLPSKVTVKGAIVLQDGTSAVRRCLLADISLMEPSRTVLSPKIAIMEARAGGLPNFVVEGLIAMLG